MTEGQFDQHFLELFAKGDSEPSVPEEWPALILAALMLVTVGGVMLLI